MTRTSKSKYLTYIEDTPKYHYLLKNIAKKSGKDAVTKSKAQDIAVTFLEEGRIVRKNADGKVRVLKKVDTTQRKVKVGSKVRIQKGQKN